MKVYLINPDNPIVSLSKVGKWNRLNKYRIWKPLGLLTLARITPSSWDAEIIDENLGPVDYAQMSRPDLVGITAFTSQASRAYQIARIFRERGCPVVMGGIHASMLVEEALQHVDAVVTGEAELQWPVVLEDVRAGRLRSHYEGGLVPVEQISAARHDLKEDSYYLDSVQTTRGCPLNCTFCSVTAFNGGKFRHRPIAGVIAELREIHKSLYLFVDDNLIGTRKDHIRYAKDLFRSMIREGLTTPWICQATINMADDEELLQLARRAGCLGVYIGFESPTLEGLVAVHKKFNLANGRDLRRSVRRIQKAGILVVGSFIMGIDSDEKGVGSVIAEACRNLGLDLANVLMLTPLPGTVLYGQMERENRIMASNFPEDWQYYTLSHPVARYKNLTWEELVSERNGFRELYYGLPGILRRVFRIAARNQMNPFKIFAGLVGNFSFRANLRSDMQVDAARFPGGRRPSVLEGLSGEAAARSYDDATRAL